MTVQSVNVAVAQGARIEEACNEAGISSRTYRRWKVSPTGEDRRAGPRRPPAHKLSSEERAEIIAIATCPAFRDLSPKQIVPRLADEGRYVASESTFYRVLHEENLQLRRGHARSPKNSKPKEHIAKGPCAVWSWDITYLRGPIRGTFFYLYLFLDIFSRKIVAAEVHTEESMDTSSEVFEAAREREGATATKLVLHSDNGGPMKGSTMVATLQRLGVVPSFSRPCVSDDNPYAEALFRTLKYRPGFPRKPFANIEEARRWVDDFVRWYNTEHLHSGIRFVTPADRHEGRDGNILAARRKLYAAAKRATPRRWTGDIRNWTPVGAVVLNPTTREVRPTAA